MQTITQILVDYSGSMEHKIEFAKRLIIEEVIPALDFSYKIGVKTFYSSDRKPNFIEVLPLNIVNREDLDSAIKNIGKPNGGTPIAAAIKNSFDELSEYPAYDKRIILITDGQETDGGDYEAEAKKAGENGVYCQIHIIGLGLDATQLTKANTISSITHGTVSNIKDTNTSKYEKSIIQNHLSNFTSAIKNPQATQSANSSVVEKETTSAFGSETSIERIDPASNKVGNPPIFAQDSSETISSSNHIEPPSEPNSNELIDLKTESNAEVIVSDLVSTIIPETTNQDVHNSSTIANSGLQSDNLTLEKSHSFSDLDFSLISGLFNAVLKRMDELFNELRVLKAEISKEGEEKANLLTSELENKEAHELVSHLLFSRYGDRIEYSNENGVNRLYKVFFKVGEQVEYHILCKTIHADLKSFSLTKMEWRLFLNNTKNTQVYLVFPKESEHEYLLVDNLLDWIMRGKLLPYLNESATIQPGRVYLTLDNSIHY